ncbi:MAG: integrase core domain-containing protein [Candidatus Thermoplasmatota archaeon]|nr:integrase core domain-containing protein [Candidatus Thermoplasmatota archaeon]
MDLTPKERERIEAIKCANEGERPVDIYHSLKRSKKWFYKWLKRYRTGHKNWYQDCTKKASSIANKTDERIESSIVEIRTILMNGKCESIKYSPLGPEAIQYQMEQMGYTSVEIPSISTITRIIKRNNLRMNKKERYKRVRSKGRHTLLNPHYIDEIHQMDYVGPRYIKGFGPVNSLHLKDVIGRQVAGFQYQDKSMNNVMMFLLNYWISHPIPKYLQVDNGMCFAGHFKHPRSISRFVRLALQVKIEIIFIAPSKPWMNGTVEEFNKQFDRLFWTREIFSDLKDMQTKWLNFQRKQNEFQNWKLRGKGLQSNKPIRFLRNDFSIDIHNIPLVTGKIHFIRIVDSKGQISLLNEQFKVGKEYIGEYVWATVETGNQLLTICYKDQKLVVRNIERYDYHIAEAVNDIDLSIFRSG